MRIKTSLSMLKKAERSFIVRGAAETFARAARTAVKPLFYSRTSVLMVRPLDAPFPRYRNFREIVSYEGTLDDCMTVDYVDGRRKAGFARHIGRGARCFLARVNGEIVSFHFGCDKPYTDADSGVTVVPESGQIYQFDGEIKREERGKVYGIQQMDWYFKKIKDEGYREAVALVDTENKSSCRFHVRIGFAPRLLCRKVRVCGIRIVRWRPWPAVWPL